MSQGASQPSDRAGTCPVCLRHIEKLAIHVRDCHKATPLTQAQQQQLLAVGFVICDGCKLPYTGAKGLHNHQRRQNACGNAVREAEPTRQVELPPLPPSEDTILQQHKALLMLPGVSSDLPAHAYDAFCATVDRLAALYREEPTAANLLTILSLPKLAIAGHLARKKAFALEQRLARYPQYTQTILSFRESAEITPMKAVQKSVELGRFTRASRLFTENTAVASVDADTISQLQALHPSGPSNPFSATTSKPTINITYEDVDLAVKAMRPDTAPGISGWTLNLFKLAFRRDTQFGMFFLDLIEAISAGTAPGYELLCASALTPLNKNPGIRPIAVGELLYRIAARVLLRALFKRTMLLPNQFGVMTKGGVEPVIRLWERAIAGDLPKQFDHGLQLDCSNAFNRMDRSVIATSIKQYAPTFYPLAKWAYNRPAPLYIRGPEGVVTLESRQGVRQGDPLGPLFFSLGYRPKLEALQRELGDEVYVTAYLDDTHILSTGSVRRTTVALFANQFEGVNADGISLNEAKCKEHFLTGEEDISILGSYLGPDPASYLSSKVDAEIRHLSNLCIIPAQHGLLLLRISLQHRLRHLLRSLPASDECKTEWLRLDMATQQAVLRMRGRSQAPTPLDASILALPLRKGGLGLLSAVDTAAHAREASIQSSDTVLDSFLNTNRMESAQIKTQRDRCAEVLDSQHRELANKLQGNQLLQFADNHSTLSRQWLYAIPYKTFSKLSNEAVAVGLHYRTLQPGHLLACKHCGARNVLGHDEVCSRKNQLKTYRHEQVKYAIQYHVATIEDTEVELERRVNDGPRTELRPDLRIIGQGSYQQHFSEYDVSIITMFASSAASFHRTPQDGATQSRLKTGQDVLLRMLDYKADLKIAKYRQHTRGAFHPILISLGGTLATETQELFRFWREQLGESRYRSLLQDISVALVRAKARFFAL